MTDVAQSILDKLRAKARSSGKNLQLLQQLFCQEEFLRRLQHSLYRENFVLKGGLLIYSISGFHGRPTQDIDFLLKNFSNSEESVEHVLQKIISTNSETSIVDFEISRLMPIAEHREYNGIRVKLLARIKNTRTPFDVDIGVGDVIIPKPEIRNIPTQLEGFEIPSIYVYSLESTIAEKFDAIISRLELTSRMKDYYDIYYLATTFPFDGRKLQDAIFETLQNRGTSYDAGTILEVGRFAENPDMLAKWAHFTKTTFKISIDFKNVIDVIMKFVEPAFNAIIHETELQKEWNPELQSYESYKPSD